MFFLACAEPPIYSQECPCLADINQRVALSWPALFFLIKSAPLVEHMTESCLVQVEQITSLTRCFDVPTSPPLHFSVCFVPLLYISSTLYCVFLFGMQLSVCIKGLRKFS